MCELASQKHRSDLLNEDFVNMLVLVSRTDRGSPDYFGVCLYGGGRPHSFGFARVGLPSRQREINESEHHHRESIDKKPAISQHENVTENYRGHPHSSHCRSQSGCFRDQEHSGHHRLEPPGPDSEYRLRYQPVDRLRHMREQGHRMWDRRKFEKDGGIQKIHRHQQANCHCCESFGRKTLPFPLRDWCNFHWRYHCSCRCHTSPSRPAISASRHVCESFISFLLRCAKIEVMVRYALAAITARATCCST